MIITKRLLFFGCLPGGFLVAYLFISGVPRSRDVNNIDFPPAINNDLPVPNRPDTHRVMLGSLLDTEAINSLLENPESHLSQIQTKLKGNELQNYLVDCSREILRLRGFSALFDVLKYVESPDTVRIITQICSKKINISNTAEVMGPASGYISRCGSNASR